MIRDYDWEKETQILKETVRNFPLEWFRQNEWRLLGQALLDDLVIAACVVATLHVDSALLAFPFWFLMATRLHALGVLTHDFGHMISLRRWPLRRLLLDFFICHPILLSVEFFAHAHAVHHHNTNIPGKDPYYLPLHRWTVGGYIWAAILAAFFLPFFLASRLATYPLTLISKKAKELHIEYFSIFGFGPYFANDGPFSDKKKGTLKYVLGPVVFCTVLTSSLKWIGVWPLSVTLVHMIVFPLLITVFLVSTLLSAEKMPRAPHAWPGTLAPTITWYTVAAILTYNGWWHHFFWSYGIPLMMMVPLFFFRLISDHTAMMARDNSIVEQVATTANMDAPWWQEFLLGPHAAPVHGFHHIAPTVPNWYWWAAHRRLKESGSKVYLSTVYRDYVAIFKAMIAEQRAWKAGEFDDHYEEALNARVDPHSVISLQPKTPRAEDHRPMVAPPAREILEGSRRRMLELDQILWEPCTPGRLQVPPELTPLFHSSLYQKLTDEERLAYNHLCADELYARTLFLEEAFFARPLSTLVASGQDRLKGDLLEACRAVLVEAEEHFRMLRKALARGAGKDATRTASAYSLPWGERWLAERCARHPWSSPWWVWGACVAHETALHLDRRLSEAGDSIDGAHRSIFRYHASEVSRHFELDHLLVEAVWDPAPGWRRFLGAHLFSRGLERFLSPRKAVLPPVHDLIARFPRLARLRGELYAEALLASDHRGYHEALYSRLTLPETMGLFDHYDEFRNMRKPPFPLYRPAPVLHHVQPARQAA